VELENSREHLRKQGLGVAAISYDSVGILDSFAKRKGIHFPLLADPGSKIIRAFGILNETVPRDNMSFGIPHPMTIVVDPNGKVLSKHFEYNIRERYTAANILTEGTEVRTGAASSEVETKHLKLRASASNEKVGFGERIRLILDIELKPKMHVYAPGVEGYRPIEWILTESPNWKQHPIVYPPTRMLNLPAIQEIVPVYEGKFTLQREITFGQAEPGDMIVSGTLRYQACDDRVCYIPQAVPVQWKIHYEPLDSERAPAQLQHTDPR
jgi:Peroxiredoxin